MAKIEMTDGWADDLAQSGAVKAFTPDPTKYHAGAGGRTMIPRANSDGTSKGFDHNKAAKMTVYKVEPGGTAVQGGFEVDCEALSETAVESAVRSSPDGFEALKRLAESTAAAASEAQDAGSSGRPVNPKMSGYVVPSSNIDGSKTRPQSGDQSLTTSDARAVDISDLGEMQMSDTPMPLYEGNAAAPSPGTHEHTEQQLYQMQQAAETREFRQQMQQQQLALAAVLEKLSAASSSDNMKEAPALPSDVCAEKEREWPHLGIRGVSERQPTKPTIKVVFNLGAAGGTVQARYHEATVQGDFIILVYDTRYEDGFQYAPPDQSLVADSVPIRMVCDDLEIDQDVRSLGIHFSLGVLDIVVLTRV